MSDWTEYLEQLQTEREAALARLDSFTHALPSAQAEVEKIVPLLEQISSANGTLQGSLETWVALQTLIGVRNGKIQFELQQALDKTRKETTMTARVSRLSWDERDSITRLNNRELVKEAMQADLAAKFIASTIHELKLRQRFLATLREELQAILNSIRLTLKLQE